MTRRHRDILCDAAVRAEGLTESEVLYRLLGLIVSCDLAFRLGVAAIDQEMKGHQDLIRQADAAMYRAKREGRNWVVAERQ